MGGSKYLYHTLATVVALACLEVMAQSADLEDFAFPADCTPGVDCYIQAMPDMDPGHEAIDPFCGSATHNGYPGTDIRVPSLADARHGIAVLAIADGIVIEARDGMADRIVSNRQDLQVIAGRECGNGLAIDHGFGVTVHYCHLRQFSLRAKPGDTVRKGEKIGEIGASGFSRYPNVHVAVLKDGQVIDPWSGLVAGDGCANRADGIRPMFADIRAGYPEIGGTALIGSGLSGSAKDRMSLTKDGPPPAVTSNSEAIIAWSWVINLHRGDRVRLTLYGPAGGVMASRTTLPANKARPEMSLYAGRHGNPVPGCYRVVVDLLRDGKPIRLTEKSVDVAG